MNAPHLHLVLNHFPIVIPFVGLFVLIAGLLISSSVTRRIAYGIFIAGALAAIPGYFTGEGAEEAVENLPGINEQVIEAHEDAAKTFVFFAYGLGVLAAVGFAAEWKKWKMAMPVAMTTIILTIAVLITAQQTGTTGGHIRHPEIKSATARALPAGNSGEEDDD